MKTETEFRYLQNGVEHFKIPLTLRKHTFEDKRVKTKFVLTDTTGNVSSPVLDYNQMNHFIYGMGMAIEYVKPTELFILFQTDRHRSKSSRVYFGVLDSEEKATTEANLASLTEYETEVVFESCTLNKLEEI